MFVNVDAGDDEGKWRSWIAAIKETLPSGGPGFGVLTMQPDDAGDFYYSGISGTVRGPLRDISVVGMSAFFPEGDAPKTGTRIKDLQLNLKGTRVILSGVVLGSRDDVQSDSLRVLMFEPGSLDDDKRGKLRSFIHKVLQSTMEQERSQA